MSSYIYDDALINKFKRWTEGTEVNLVGPDESRRLFQVLSDKSNDSNIKFPLVSLKRSLGYDIDLYGKKPITFDGAKLEANSKKVKSIVYIPITLNYQLDIYTRYYQEADEYMRNFIFNIINYPKLEITIKYFNSNIDHVANILPTQSVIDKYTVYKDFGNETIGPWEQGTQIQTGDIDWGIQNAKVLKNKG